MEGIESAKVSFFQNQLSQWFRENRRHFPWREKNVELYQLIVSETLLQRTKAETVAKFFPSFIGRYPTWDSLAASDLLELEEILKPIGLYRQKAKRLKALGGEMQNRKGEFPKSREELMEIPFLGQYISNAVQLFSFKMPSPLLDVNMARLLERFFGERRLADIRYDPYLQELAQTVLMVNDPVLFNWAILDFGALVCKARNPICSSCMLRQKCRLYQSTSPK